MTTDSVAIAEVLFIHPYLYKPQQIYTSYPVLHCSHFPNIGRSIYPSVRLYSFFNPVHHPHTRSTHLLGCPLQNRQQQPVGGCRLIKVCTRSIMVLCFWYLKEYNTQ